MPALVSKTLLTVNGNKTMTGNLAHAWEPHERNRDLHFVTRDGHLAC
jgi:hypothetical protein